MLVCRARREWHGTAFRPPSSSASRKSGVMPFRHRVKSWAAGDISTFCHAHICGDLATRTWPLSFINHKEHKGTDRVRFELRLNQNFLRRGHAGLAKTRAVELR